MTLICGLRAVRFSLWVHMQDQSSHFAPVRPVALRLQKANVRDDMLFVIGRKHRVIRRTVRHVWIEGGFLHHTALKLPETAPWFGRNPDLRCPLESWMFIQ